MGNKPVKRFSAGLLNVAVWRNKGTSRYGEESVFHTVSISRGYKSQGEFKSTGSLRPEDLGTARDLLQQAEDFLNSGSSEMEEEIVEEVL